MKPDFEEKTFEVAANFELGLLGSTIDFWAPGQVLEGVLGFDVLAQLDGDASEVIDLIGMAIPPGLFWKQCFGYPSGADSAPDWASLFLQYKRPDRMLRRRGKFLRLFGGPYYRFDIDESQHISLAEFQEASSGQALVCYAAPKFHTSDDMMFYRQNRLVLERTAFIEISGLGGHDYGAYDEDDAFLCSEPEAVFMYGLPGLLRTLYRIDRARDASSSEGLSRHLRTLANAIAEVSSADLQVLGQEELAPIVQTILEFTHTSDTTWLLCALNRS